MATTNANPQYYRSNFMDKVFDPQTGYEEVDPLSPRIHEIINGITSWQIHPYKAGERLTTIANFYHGTTSTWWIILMFNGLVSTMELQPGMLLKIPSLSQFREARQRTATVVPTIVTI